MPTTRTTHPNKRATTRTTHSTRPVTLYRLAECHSIDTILDAIDTQAIEGLPSWHLDEPSIASCRSVFIHAGVPPREAEWCSDASATTGVGLDLRTATAGGLLVIDVDGILYGYGYGCGHRWLLEEARNPRFGLRIAIRCLDADQIKDLVRRTPGARGRTDSILVPGGASIWHLGNDQYSKVVRRIGGKVRPDALPTGGGRASSVSIDGACALSVRLSVAPTALVADLRAISEVYDREQPDPDLAFVENITPIADPALIGQLDADLDQVLGEDAPAADRLTVAVPEAHLNNLAATHAYRIRIGSAQARTVPDLDIAEFLLRTHRQDPGRRLTALRSGRVELLSAIDPAEVLGGSAAINWVEATGSVGERRFFLMDGTWYELAAGYQAEVRAYVERLLALPTPEIDLPRWVEGTEEKHYNEHVEDVRPNYVCLDRNCIRTTTLHHRSGVEICDLLGPNNELIHVKKASGSAPLSHLFAQGLVSTQALIGAPEARKRFAAAVATRATKRGRTRTLPEDFVPSTVVFAILLKNGEDLTVDSLFPFAQVMLRQTALLLEGTAEVRVVPIRRKNTGQAALAA